MPIDGSGNFSRSFNFQQDRDNGIKILASHVDGEFDNFAAAMNQVFFRNGLVSMSADLNLGLNRIIGIGDGLVNNPAIKWNTDPLTGLYLSAYGKLAITATGNKIAEFATTGTTFAGPVFFNGDAQNYRSMIGSNPQANFDANDYILYDRAANSYNFIVGNQAAAYLRGPAGAVDFYGTNMFLNGNQVWQAANLPNPAQTTGATFTGDVLRGPNYGLRYFNADQPANFFNATSYLAYGLTPQAYYLVTEGTTRAVFPKTGNIDLYSSTGSVFINGSQIYSAANFNPANYAALTGANFTGDVLTTGAFKSNIMYPGNDAQFYMNKNGGGAPVVNFDVTDYQTYDRTNNAHVFVVGNQNAAVFRGPGGNVDLYGAGLYFNGVRIA